ncbi:hypothetical protein E2C01_009790 [Portunus trituberculatus]|uniref:Uncharacterized protein n=1 Tax=Portunus trituberculatus TaxID=210409 RepID=A0A5B7D6P6_PORTR|nr:hypothetical protein [Portunus trituberculatus]
MRREIECNPEQLREKNLGHKDQDKQRLSQTTASLHHYADSAPKDLHVPGSAPSLSPLSNM